MKFMKLGFRPDTFYTVDAVRCVSTEVSSDIIIQVQGSKYLLHKFPLLSKCLRLKRLWSESSESSQHQIIQLPDFPGGIEPFETCMKFCYGITITLSPLNIVSIRCAAEYLQMTEDLEKGNLINKLDVFLNSCILHGWKDSIITLQRTKYFPLWSEDLHITSKCIDVIASKVQSNPTKVNLSHSHSRRGRDDISCNGIESHRHKNAPKGWWGEDIAELDVDLFWRTMVAIKSSGEISCKIIGDALKIYASRWLPNICKNGIVSKQVVSDPGSHSKDKLLLESIISLIPMEKGAVSCSFLLKLLKAAGILGVSSSSKMELARRVGLQLEEAKVSDLLIPSLSYTNDTLYDVDIVITIVEHFMLQGQSPPTSPPRGKSDLERRRSRSAKNVDFEFRESRRTSSASHSSKLRVAKLVDGYLQEIGRDVNLPLSKVIALSEAIPDFARSDHDDLYRAIDIYLKAHPDLNKSERKQLCRILDCKKLSMEACMHAAQNELLPLRVVVQVLFFEQARAAMGGSQATELPNNIKTLLTGQEDDQSNPPPPPRSTIVTDTAEDSWGTSVHKSSKSKPSTLRMKLDEDNSDTEDNVMNSDGRISRLKSFCALPAKPKRMFSKLWSINRSLRH